MGVDHHVQIRLKLAKLDLASFSPTETCTESNAMDECNMV